MADQDFEIKVVTTADTTGIRQTSDALDDLNAKGRQQSERGSSLRGAFLAPVPEELKTTADNGEKIAEAMEKAGGGSLFLGANLTRARSEAMILVRELGTGVPTTRTLSSLMGSLGVGIAGAALAGFALNRAITSYGDNQLKINKELDEQLTKLTESAQKWKEIAQAATSLEDVGKLSGDILPSLDAAAKKFRDFQNAGTSWWQDLLDNLIKIPGFVGGPFEKAFTDMASQLASGTEEIRKQAAAAIKLGEEYSDAFDKEKVRPFNEAITDLNQQLANHRNLQRSLGSENVESWHSEEVIIQRIIKEISQLTQLQAEHQRLRDKTEKYIQTADPQVQAILKNEKAMQDARAQGREQDAAAFERTAQALHKGATPAQEAELSKIYGAPEIVEALKQLAADKRSLIELWR